MDFSTDDFLQALKLMAARRRHLQGKKKEKARRSETQLCSSLAVQSYGLRPV